MTTVYFQDGYPAEVDIEIETLWEMFSAVLKGNAEIKIRVKWGSRGSLLYNLEYIDSKRTFEQLPIPPAPDTLKAPPPSCDGESDE